MSQVNENEGRGCKIEKEERGMNTTRANWNKLQDLRAAPSVSSEQRGGIEGTPGPCTPSAIASSTGRRHRTPQPLTLFTILQNYLYSKKCVEIFFSKY